MLANVAPIAVDDAYVFQLGVSVSISDSTGDETPSIVSDNGVLANDTDVDGDALRASKLSDPEHGTLTLNSDGTFTYVHDGGNARQDSFTYVAEDGHGNSDSATVRLSIVNTWAPPPQVRFDVNNDGFVTPIDALIVINKLNLEGAHKLPNPPLPPNIPPPFYDVNDDGYVSAVDVLMVLNYLIKQAPQAEGESTVAKANSFDEQHDWLKLGDLAFDQESSWTIRELVVE